MTVEAIEFASTDGTVLEGELALGADPWAGAVLCHPHPRYGGSMRSLLIGELFRALPAAGIGALRFNFRGVERSGGTWDDGRAEQGDVVAAIDLLAAWTPAGTPLVLIGWSFGADMALSAVDARVAGWCLIAPPLRYTSAMDAIGHDPRPKCVILGARDDVVPSERVDEAIRTWATTTRVVIPGASHFFIGRAAQVADAVVGFARRIARR
jgi:alpha/beta superfamily hydrolase